MATKRVLITGLNGFTGRYVAAEMAAAGWEVFGIGDVPADIPGYFQVNLDDLPGLTEVIAEVRPQAVMHLAGVAFVGHGDADAFYRINLIGTRRLLQALVDCKLESLRCVLLASSANVYGNGVGEVLTESSPVNPANDYAVSKLAMEHMSRLWGGRLPIVIARPFNYTGVGQSELFLLPKVISHFRKGLREIELGNLDVRRDFGDVRAVSRAYRALVERAPVGQTINVCSGATHSLRDVLDFAESIAGYHIEVRINPAFVRANEVCVLAGSAERLKSIIGDWSVPPLYETLEWMYRA